MSYRTEYRRKLYQSLPEDVRDLIPIRHIERLKRLAQEDQDRFIAALRQTKAFREAVIESGLQHVFGTFDSPSDSRQIQDTDTAAAQESAIRAKDAVAQEESADLSSVVDLVAGLLADTLPSYDRLSARFVVSEHPMNGLVRVYKSCQDAWDSMRYIPSGAVGLLAILHHFERLIVEEIKTKAPLEVAYTQSNLPMESPVSSLNSTLYSRIDEAHAILDRAEGKRSENRSLQGLVYRLNDVLHNRKENLP